MRRAVLAAMRMGFTRDEAMDMPVTEMEAYFRAQKELIDGRPVTKTYAVRSKERKGRTR